MNSVKELETSIINYDTLTVLQFEEIKEEFLQKLNHVIQLKDKDFLKIFEELVSWIKFCQKNKITNKFLIENILLKWTTDDDFEGVVDVDDDLVSDFNIEEYGAYYADASTNQ
jgi:hypothetical protein